MTMIRRTVCLPPELDAFIERERSGRGWTRSMWLQELLKAQLEHVAKAAFFSGSIPTQSRSIVDVQTESTR